MAKKLIKSLVIKIIQMYAKYFVYNFNYYFKVSYNAHKNEKIKSEIPLIGDNIKVGNDVKITDPLGMNISSNVSLGERGFYLSQGGINIGEGVVIGADVKFYTVYHEKTGLKVDSINIGKNCFIGNDTVLYGGVNISDNQVIESSAIIKKDVGVEDDVSYEGENLFFILSSGRSGSQSIAHTLNNHKEIVCLHEPKSQLVSLSSRYVHKEITKEKVVRELKQMYAKSNTAKINLYGESDMYLVPILDVLIEVFPKAKFIWQIRDGREVVSSGVGRDWFGKSEIERAKPISFEERGWYYYYYKINPSRMNIFSEAEWEGMSVFQRNCWYWNFINCKIESDLKSVDKENVLFVRLEDLNENVDFIFDFLKIKNQSIRMHKKNSGKYAINKYSKWSDANKLYFKDSCGELMRRLYNDTYKDF